MQQSVLTLEYVKVPVSATSSGAVVNPTGDAVVMAFTLADVNPGVSDWQAATWETDTTTDPDTYYARCLVGPGGTFVPTAATTYDVWVRISDSPEIPARRAGNLEIT